MLKCESKIYPQVSGALIYIPPKLATDSQFPIDSKKVMIEIVDNKLIITSIKKETKTKK